MSVLPMNDGCPVARWKSFAVIYAIGDGVRRFTELRREIDGISQRMLTVTLRGLERAG
ncbi:MAG: helix-turn-helix transcriptional regulator [Streptosporangiales bacterium]|nr:helix-turn-helix transcriptional regulator [Streptosporangiales bacterium]MBO0892571.1 helix-turn-helix transcriptional regulator [Acidothermales bacterium]